MPQCKGSEGERHEKRGPRAVRTPAVLPESAVLHSAPGLGKVRVEGQRCGPGNPHRFRRTLATNLIGRGMPIQNVAVILGHDKLDTTMKYVYLDKADVRNSYKRYM